MKEADAYKRIINGAFRARWALYRIADGSWGRKPFDVGGVDAGGRAVAIEVKYQRGKRWGGFPPIGLLEPHQLVWLEAVARNGGRAYLALANDAGCAFVPVSEGWRGRLIEEVTEFTVSWEEGFSASWPEEKK